MQATALTRIASLHSPHRTREREEIGPGTPKDARGQPPARPRHGRHCGRGEATPCWPVPGPPPSLPYLAAPSPAAPQPAGTRPRRSIAVNNARRAPPERSQSTPGRPPLSSFLHATPSLHPAPWPPHNVAAPRTAPTASGHDLWCPLSPVHRAPDRRYKSPPPPEHPVPPHLTTASPPHTLASRAPPGGRSRSREARLPVVLPELAVSEVDDDHGQAVLASLSLLSGPYPPSPLLPRSPGPFSPLDRAQERRGDLAGVGARPRRRSCSPPTIGAAPPRAVRPASLPKSPPSICIIRTASRAPR